MNRIYDDLNDIDFNLDSYELEDLSEMEKFKMKKNIRRSLGDKRKKSNSVKYLVTAASLGLVILGLGTNLGQSVYARAESRLNSLSYSLSQALGGSKDLRAYSQVLDQVQEAKGVEVKLDQVVLNGEELIFTSLVDPGQAIDGFNFQDEFYINGKELKNYSLSGSSGVLDGNVFSQVSSLNLGDMELDGVTQFDYIIRKINFSQGEESYSVRGPWKFSFLADDLELRKDSINYDLGETIDLGSTSYRLESLKINDVNSKIYGSRSSKAAYDVDLVGRANTGQEVKFYMSEAYDDQVIFKQATNVDLRDLDYIDFRVDYRAYPKKSGRIDTEIFSLDKGFRIDLR